MLSIICLAVVVYGVAAEFPNMDDPRASPQQPLTNVRFGDIKLTPEQEKAMYGDKKSYAVVKESYRRRWKNAIIPYKIDCSLEHLPSAVEAIHAAMQEWEAKTCIRFVQWTNETYHLNFFRDTHCWGNVGEVSYSRISVGPGCDYQHVMTHEIGHVVGFYHEQNRLDRDDYVTVHWSEIGQFRDAFDKVQQTSSMGVDYDYESIMHYPWTAFSATGGKTMTPKRNYRNLVPYIALSDKDAQQTSLMYNCPKIERQRKRQVLLSSDDTNVKYSPYNACVDKDRSGNCGAWAKAGFCSAHEYVRLNCRRTCNAPGCTKVPCQDRHPYCKDWAKHGHCSVSTVMRECALSCNPQCSGKGTVAPKTNQPTQAPSEQPTEAPQTNAPQTNAPETNAPETNAPQTNAPQTNAPQTNAPITGAVPTRGPEPTEIPLSKILGKGILCEDYHKKCAYWAKMGECKRNPGYMLRSCMRSCKVSSCDMSVLKPAGTCAEPLGMAFDGTKSKWKIPDSAITGKGGYLAPGGGWEAGYSNARLYFRDDYANKRIAAWCAVSHDQAKDPTQNYVQVDLGKQTTVTHIATQGRDKYFERIREYKVSYSTDGVNYQYYENEKVFDGSCDHVTPIVNKFDPPINAQFVRVHAHSWNWPCIRMELYGC